MKQIVLFFCTCIFFTDCNHTKVVNISTEAEAIHKIEDQLTEANKVKDNDKIPSFIAPGAVFLFFSKYNKNPKDSQVNLELFTCFSIFVKDIKPGNTIMIDDNAISYPVKLTDLERGEYFVQAVWD